MPKVPTTKKNPVRKTKPPKQVREEVPFEAIAVSTADEYNLESVVVIFQTFGFELVELPDDIVEDTLHFKAKLSGHESKEIFVFREGSIVFWNISDEERLDILQLMKNISTNSYKDLELESLDYTFDEKTKTRLHKGDVILNPTSTLYLLEQYAFSNALSLSVKLATWESALEQFVNSTTHLTDDMKDGKGVKLSREEIFQKTGQLYALKHEINLNSDLLDTPDFYWERETLEQLFRQTCSTLNIQRRTRVMNEKLSNCCDLMELLSHYLDDKHHCRLEWIIIILIMVEVFFEVVHFAERIFEHMLADVTEAVEH